MSDNLTTSFLDLPAEIKFQILENVPPLQLTAFTWTCRDGRTSCDEYLRIRAQWLEQEDKQDDEQKHTFSRAARYLRALSHSLRAAIKTTLEFVQYPDISRRIDGGTETFLMQTAHAVDSARAGYLNTLTYLEEAEEAARNAGLPPPKSDAIKRLYCAARATKAQMWEKDARACAPNADRCTLAYLDEAKNARRDAGLPPPNYNAIERVYWAARAQKSEEYARAYAPKVHRVTLAYIREAEEAARNAGLQPPDLSALKT